jgi:hypothetical protein
LNTDQGHHSYHNFELTILNPRKRKSALLLLEKIAKFEDLLVAQQLVSEKRKQSTMIHQMFRLMKAH